MLMNDDEAREHCKQTVPFWPVGEVTSAQLLVELRLAGQRLEIQAGVMKQWSERFYTLAASLEKAATR
jgi:hypothetical protein